MSIKTFFRKPKRRMKLTSRYVIELVIKVNPRPDRGGGATPPPPRGFSQIAKKTAA